MRIARIAALALVSSIATLSFALSFFPNFDYRRQDRENIGCTASRKHWLGTDALGRDRLARVVHGTRMSLLLAPAAAFFSLLLALSFGAAPGFFGGYVEKAAIALIDLMVSIPWFFLLLTVRAILPLNTSPLASAAVTFLVLGLLGWGVPARVLLTCSRGLRKSDAILLATAAGISRTRLLGRHVIPKLWPVLTVQFWIAVSVFILAEANLSLLGLGVSEPMPSLGNLVRELESVLSIRGNVCNFAGLAVLLVLVGSLQTAFSGREAS